MSRRKLYYPQGQIQKGLYTNGGEWMFVDGTEYVGDYHKYTTGEVYTISSYIDGVSKELIPYQNVQNYSIKQNFEYTKLTSELDKFHLANFGKELPTQDDYNKGFMLRYIVQRKSSNLITEVTNDESSNIQEEHYNKVTLPWKLVGDAIVVNQRVVNSIEKDIEGISNYITDYSEFVKV